MKRRPPEVPEVAPDVVRDRIHKMEIACRRRSIMTTDDKALAAAAGLMALVDSNSTDIAEALRLWHTLEWLVEAP